MKKIVLVFLVTVLAAVISPCSTPSASQPQKGGVFRQISSYNPVALGYFPLMGPGEEIAAMPAAEKLLQYDDNKQLQPELAEAVNYDKTTSTITFKIRKGIKFTDGSDLNAEAVAWNIQTAKNEGRLQYRDSLKSIDTPDPNTLVLHVTEYNNQLLSAYGWVPIFSKKAFEILGKEGVKLNPVCTGPFKLVEYKRDNYIIWEKNPNYWRPGYPLMDGIKVLIVPDPVTASMMMEGKKADEWRGPTQEEVRLLNVGLVRQGGFGSPYMLFMNTKPGSKFADKRMREAIEYAVDRPSISKALGFGLWISQHCIAPTGEWGYDPNYNPRPYNKQKAKKLIADAGYAGKTIKLITGNTQPYPDMAQSLKQYLDEVGITLDIDLADSGRFRSSQWETGWDELLLISINIDADYLNSMLRHFGPEPLSEYISWVKPPELVELASQAYRMDNAKDQKELSGKIVKLMGDDAMVIPLWTIPAGYIIQPWVHTDYMKQHVVTRNWWRTWMDKQ